MRLFACCILALLVLSCSKKSQDELTVGEWRGTINIQQQELPFNFTLSKDSGRYVVVVKNGDESLKLDEVSVTGDSINMPMHIFDAELRAKMEGDSMKGYFIRNYAPGSRFPFKALAGQNFRFIKNGPSSVDFSGKYDVHFFGEKDTTVSVGIFSQKENHVTGTFLMNDGDFRYLEGNVVGDELRLSAFDGNHTFLFTALKKGDSVSGEFFSGKSSHSLWKGKLNPNAKMPDPESLAGLKPGFEKIEFSFPDLDKKPVSLTDEKYKNKVVILQILGTWCPNCLDETQFLAPWYKKNKDRGVEVLGLAYERKPDFDYASNRVRIMKKKLGMDYDVLIAGVNDKKKTGASLPALNNFVGFPTTIFIGKDGKVKKIHSGFSGPGTGVYYDEFIQYFNATVDEMLKEKI